MKFFKIAVVVTFLVLNLSCKDDAATSTSKSETSANSIVHAKGLAIYKYAGYSVVEVSTPWPDAKQSYSYVLKQRNATVPDSLKSHPTIEVPIRKIIVTATTHIPSLEMLGVENSLIGFPHCDYISSERVRARIDAGHVKEVGNTLNLNTEIILDLNPDLIVAHGIDGNNPALDNLQKSGLNVMLNGDWNEQTALGKAEWIKFFGALYGLENKADSIFSDIEREYNNTLALAKKVERRPTVLSGAIYENNWYLPQGDSWGALLIAQAGGDYLWSDSVGTGSLSLAFETVLEKAQNAAVWIGPGQYTSLAEMTTANPHYSQFDAFKNKKVYSYSSKKGKTGGIIYFELAPNRPDLVIKDLVKILHPELLPDHQLYFFEKVN